MRYITLLLSVIAVLTTGSSGWSQQAYPMAGDDVRGYSGTVQIFPNPALHTVTVALASATPLSKSSSQLVLVIQGNFSDYPEAWKGAARLLVSRSFVGVVRPSTFGDEIVDSYKFSDVGVPDGVKSMRAGVMRDAYGIARYGEVKPLTTQQIRNLATRNRLN